MDFFAQGVQTLVNPPAKALTEVSDRTSDFFSGIAHARSLTEENRALKMRLAGLALYSEDLERLHGEIDQLRALQGFQAIEGRSKVPAEVIGYFPYENRFTLNVGWDSGVKVGQPVVAAGGLLGKIQVVTGKTSQVLLLASPEPSNRIGALALRNPPSAGLLRGESSATFVLEFSDPKAPVATGDLVVTAGFSEHIPRGIPIGRVIQVDDNVEFGKRQARVYPSASIGNVREVFVLK